MKKRTKFRHLMSLLFWLFSIGLIYGQNKQTVVLYPKNFVGVINKSGTYLEQKLSSGILLGNNSGSIGRGYVEFDLSKIPADATIEFAELKLIPKIDVAPDKFGGKIRLETAGKDFQYPSKAMWDLLKTIGTTGDYLGVEVEFKNTADRHYLSDRLITSAITENKGKTVAFKLNHKNEGGNVYIHLSGGQDISLEISYSTSSTTQPPTTPGGGAYFNSYIGGEADLKMDREYSYVHHSKRRASLYCDESLFSKIKKENNVLILKAKPTLGIVKTKLELKEGSVVESSVFLHIQGTFPVSTQERIIGIGENIEFSVPGVDNLDSSELIWEPASANMILISGQGTPSALFKATGSGSGFVRATVKYKNGKEQMISVTRTADVWVGAPSSVTLSSGGGKTLYPYTTYKITAQSGGGTQYAWSLMGDARFVDYSGTQATTDKDYVYIRTGAGDPSMGSLLRVRCTVSNKFGSQQGSLNLGFQGGYSVRVYSLYTKEILHTEKNADNFNINNTNLTKGIYLIEKTSEDGEVKVEKIMKTQE